MWSVELDKRAYRDIERLGKVDRDRVRRFIDDRLVGAENPRKYGKPLTGNRAGLWRYRVGDMRIIVELFDKRLVVLVLAIPNRREAYR